MIQVSQKRTNFKALLTENSEERVFTARQRGGRTDDAPENFSLTFCVLTTIDIFTSFNVL